MTRLVLALSALAALASADLCFDGMEVAAACTAGTDLGERLMTALYQCDYNTAYTKRSAGDEDWHQVLDRRGLNRQNNCHDVQEIQQDFYTYASYGICIMEQLGWYDPANTGSLNIGQYKDDVMSLAPPVASALLFEGDMGLCWNNMTSDYNDYFQGCEYSDEDVVTLWSIISAWSDMTCFAYVFDDTCSNFLRSEIYNYFYQNYDNSDYYTDISTTYPPNK